jgi:hypothetical protein
MSGNSDSHAIQDARRARIVTTGVIVLVASAASLAAAQVYPRDMARSPTSSSAASTVNVYPSNGQSAEQADRDRYECHEWAVQQTGFDPSGTHVAPHQRVDVVAAAPNGGHAGAGVGAATGAVLGAVVAHPGNAGPGALIGAALGGIVGGATDAARAQQAQDEVQQVRERESARDAAHTERFEEQSANYRRAITACLQGRGYTVS